MIWIFSSAKNHRRILHRISRTASLADGSKAHTPDALIFFECSVLWLSVRRDSSAPGVDHLIHADFTIRKEISREENDARPVCTWPHDFNGLGGRYNSWTHV
jgi:hypothetical protein